MNGNHRTSTSLNTRTTLGLAAVALVVGALFAPAVSASNDDVGFDPLQLYVAFSEPDETLAVWEESNGVPGLQETSTFDPQRGVDTPADTHHATFAYSAFTYNIPCGPGIIWQVLCIVLDAVDDLARDVLTIVRIVVVYVWQKVNDVLDPVEEIVCDLICWHITYDLSPELYAGAPGYGLSGVSAAPG